MKTFKYVLIAVLIFVVTVTGYYTIKRYIINDGLKGISPDNILNICLFLILPIIIGLFIIKRLEKKR
ncbi:hypothetical protein M0G43_09475 [Subsaxibacter sp. CAU 1640]|uniref:hypothetical protein n=1 Tax=Subsaxibacter sp. CAU 1640 TaxID=2933271 RepID=UPI002004B03C|nr:hypothetical protein [Subsaxibacter sp. CAU 1640]MCK7590802.1 hypothetical protein [Subsaxibacter sp. CAU 1640]